MTEPKYTAQNILAGWDALQERNKKRRRFPTIINELHALSNPSFRNSAAYRNNQAYISTLGDADFTDYSRRMNMLAKEEQAELKSLFMGRMTEADLPNVEAFDEWAAGQGSFVWKRRDEFFNMWDKRMDTIREQTKYAEEGQIDTLVGGVMSKYYTRLAQTTDPNEQAAIIQEANSILTDLSSSGKLPYSLSGKVRSTVNERLRKIVGDSRDVAGAIQKAQEREETIEDRNKAALDRALKSGRIIMSRQLEQQAVDRISKAEDYETVYRDIMNQATTPDSEHYIADNDILSSLRQSLSALKPGKKPSAFQYVAQMEKDLVQMFDPNDPSSEARDENARNVASKIATEERTRGDANPVFYNYTKKQRKGIVIETILDTYLRVNPGAFDPEGLLEDAGVIITSERFAQDSRPQKVKVDEIISMFAKQIGMPFEVTEYILFPERFVIGAKQ